jgi:hypothetical protein
VRGSAIMDCFYVQKRHDSVVRLAMKALFGVDRDGRDNLPKGMPKLNRVPVQYVNRVRGRVWPRPRRCQIKIGIGIGIVVEALNACFDFGFDSDADFDEHD